MRFGEKCGKEGKPQGSDQGQGDFESLLSLALVWTLGWGCPHVYTT